MDLNPPAARPPQSTHKPSVPTPTAVTRLETSFALYPLSEDEVHTCEALLEAEPNSDICLMPTHNINVEGTLEGFKFAAPTDSSATVLPINRKMFFGHTMTECSSSICVNSDVIELLRRQDECRELMREFLQEIHEQSKKNRASFDCIPQNVDAHLTNFNDTLAIEQKRSTDAKAWVPELPESIGLYHTYTRGFNKVSSQAKRCLFLPNCTSLFSTLPYPTSRLLTPPEHKPRLATLPGPTSWLPTLPGPTPQ